MSQTTAAGRQQQHQQEDDSLVLVGQERKYLGYKREHNSKHAVLYERSCEQLSTLHCSVEVHGNVTVDARAADHTLVLPSLINTHLDEQEVLEA